VAALATSDPQQGECEGGEIIKKRERREKKRWKRKKRKREING